MEQTPRDNPQPNPPRRRRKRSKWQNFKEAYLPVVLVIAVVALIIAFIVGSVSRSEKTENPDTQPTDQVSQDQAALLQQEAATLLAEAEKLALYYDYAGAIEILSTFSGDMTAVSGMKEKYDEYCESFARLFPYTDVENVPHLSFNTLMVDVALAQNHPENGSEYSADCITRAEFSAILDQLYAKGYILVSIHDLVKQTVGADGAVTLTPGKLYLPEGRKPIILSWTDANYDADMASAGSGFASKLVVDVTGCLSNEMILADGSVSTGSFDFMPILSDFVRAHPDFSYHGARATIAVAGHDGVLGYPTAADASAVIETAKAEGYDFACYTYDDIEYGNLTAPEIKADLLQWTALVAPALGQTDILLYPYGQDFTEDSSYTSDAYLQIKENGFHYLVGTDSTSAAWGDVNELFLLQTRRWVNGTNLVQRPERFEDLFDGAAIADPQRTPVQ